MGKQELIIVLQFSRQNQNYTGRARKAFHGLCHNNLLLHRVLPKTQKILPSHSFPVENDDLALINHRCVAKMCHALKKCQ
jgi:hypothetical protein